MKKQIADLNLLVEIGAEELPLSALDLIYSDFRPAFSKLLERERISFSEIKEEATPRRIAFFVAGLSAKQQDLNLEISGPSFEKAYGADGKPTPALLGFMKSKEITDKDIEVRETPKGKFIFGRKELKGRPVAQVLPALIQEVFQTMPFKRGLRWDATGYKFPRPIRWIVAILGNQVLKFKIADVTSGKISQGHRFLSPKPFSILKADWQLYQKMLEKQHVILPIERREALIQEGLKKTYGQTHLDSELVHECAQLVEKPFLLEGGFSKEYLELPAEVLATCMKKHQRVFAVYQNGKLQNKFVAVMNGRREGLKKISADFEKVLDSRLKDARFFFKEDTQKHLETYREKLNQLAYLGALGSMRDKTDRLEKIAETFCGLAGKREHAAALKRVCALAKNDLLTHLVFEMPELQGVVGGEYARHFGEKDEVAKAVATQYLPKNLAEKRVHIQEQMTELGALFGVLDRLDLLAGAFGTGIEPSGSQDPFALRRAGGILVKLAHAFNLRFSLNETLLAIEQQYGAKLTKPEGKSRLIRFLQERIAFEIGVKPGSHEHEIFQAVTKAKFDDIADVFVRYEKLNLVSRENRALFVEAVKIIQRISNILKGSKEPLAGWAADKLTEEKEISLAAALSSVRQAVAAKANQGDLQEANRLFAEMLAKPVTDFF